MGSTAVRLLVVCFGILLVLLNKPLGRLTAEWQRIVGMDADMVNESLNRVVFAIGGAVFVILALWAD